MKTNKQNFFTGFLAIVFSIVLITSCKPEYEAEIFAYPEISVDAVSPASGYSGSIVTITGSNFGDHQKAAHVSFNGVLATEFLSYTDGVMEVVVPQLAQSGKVSVQVWTHTKDSVASYTVIPLPIIESVVSGSTLGSNIALPGDTVTLTGSGFGTDASKFTVTFGGDVEAEVILPVQDDQVKVIAPEGFSTGNVSFLVGGTAVVGEPAIINPNAPGDITPYFLANTGDFDGGGLFVRGDGLNSRWGTLGAPWIANNAVLNKEGGTVGGYGQESWSGPVGYIVFETWGNTPILDGKLYQQTTLELPEGNYTFSFDYDSEVTTNSTVHAVVAAGDGLPSLGDLDTSLGYTETWNDTPIDATSPNIREIGEVNFTLGTSQKVSIGFLINMQGADVRAGYFKVYWIKLVKN